MQSQSSKALGELTGGNKASVSVWAASEDQTSSDCKAGLGTGLKGVED